MDWGNALFEFGGSLVLWFNVKAIRKDRGVKGFKWQTTLFFTSWGIWNIFYYSHLQQWASLVGGLFICAVNIIWLSHVFYYALERRLSRSWLVVGRRREDLPPEEVP